jgi:YHS domain-containing protein
MRALLFLVVLALAVVMIPSLLRAWRRGAMSPSRTQHDELVKDPVCQTYILVSRAVTTEVAGVPTHFCSRECAARYGREDRRQ